MKDQNNCRGCHVHGLCDLIALGHRGTRHPGSLPSPASGRNAIAAEREASPSIRNFGKHLLINPTLNSRCILEFLNDILVFLEVRASGGNKKGENI